MTDTPTMLEALQEAAHRAGSQAALAEICGCSQPAIWKMLQSAKRLTPCYVLKVEKATGVSRHYLRPDFYPFADARRLPPFERTFDQPPPAPRRRRQSRVAQAVAG